MKKLTAAKTTPKELVIAPAWLYVEADMQPLLTKIRTDEQSLEKEKFEQAKKIVSEELQQLSAVNEIFSAHLDLLEDITLKERIFSKIEKNKNVQLSVQETIAEVASVFDAMEDVYLSERAADVRDIGKRMMAALKGICLSEPERLTREVIVVAKELFPSDIIKLNPVYVKGILTEEGGVTSHASILARNRNIPVMTGIKGLMASIRDDMLLCMDTAEGIVIADPDEKEQEAFLQRKAVFEAHRKELSVLRNCEPVTKDGRRIRLCANVGSIGEIHKALGKNIDGIGLFRSEFLYFERKHFPTEEEQFAVYKEAAELVPELTVRTLDIGGDKELPYYKPEKERNPFLGWRGIRVSLEWTQRFKEQLRAILRAGYYGNVRMLLPMIISAEELRQVKRLTEICKNELRRERIPFDEKLKIGILMETPASVLLADSFAKEADFFSIGTNDLTQYLLAVDRENKKVSALYDCFHPAVLEAIRLIIEAAQKENIRVSMCGEMAGDKNAIPLLLEMGLKEFSMSAASIDDVRAKILNC